MKVIVKDDHILWASHYLRFLFRMKVLCRIMTRLPIVIAIKEIVYKYGVDRHRQCRYDICH